MTVKSRKVKASLWKCTCIRCGHHWETIRMEPPPQCAKCGSRNWNKPARPYKKRAPKA